MNTFLNHPVADAIVFAAVVLALIRPTLDFIHTSRLEAAEDIKELRHTINVNHGILVRELATLSGIANKATQSNNVSDAKRLLQKATLVADAVPQRVLSGDKESLGGLLTDVFGAMNKSTSARRLLGACLPYSLM
jgi:hypothetical protein